MMTWQPIATAPRDGTPFIAAVPFGGGEWEISKMMWEEFRHAFIDATYSPFDETQPTHWMPLPEPPE